MSFELVDQAARSPAFDPTPPPESLAEAHVPLAILTGDDLEGEIQAQLANYGRLALVAPIGAGKSSVARYVLRANSEGLAPIWINVATEDHDRISTVRGFLEILAGQLIAKARRATQIGDSTRRDLLRRVQQFEPLGRDEAKLRAALGGSYWLLKGELAAELARSFDHGQAYRATVDVRDAVKEVLAILADSELVPVLVADDTDRLLKVSADRELSERLFVGFFGEVLREIAEQLECGLLVAAHERYTERADYRELTAGLLRPIALPSLNQPEQFGRLITARAEFLSESASWRDLVSEEALAVLARVHRDAHGHSVRRTLTTLREALGLAASQGADLVAGLHVEGAAAGQSPDLSR